MLAVQAYQKKKDMRQKIDTEIEHNCSFLHIIYIYIHIYIYIYIYIHTHTYIYYV